MKSKLDLNLDGVSYLKKGEAPEVISKDNLYTILANRDLTFRVSNEMMGIIFNCWGCGG